MGVSLKTGTEDIVATDFPSIHGSEYTQDGLGNARKNPMLLDL